MQASGICLVLGFFFLNVLDSKNFAQGKAFPEDEDEYKYRYNKKLKRFHPIYKRNLGPKLYYPHIDGKPIFIPSVAGSVGHVNKLIDDHYERNKEYGQSWTFTSPATYDYDHSNQRDYYEDSVTSNSMIKNFFDSYERGVHRGDYHTLSSTPKSYVSFGAKHTNENFKNKSDKQNLRKKDKRRKNNRDFHDISKDPNYTESKFEVVSPDYAPRATEVIGKKLPIDQVAEDLVDINISDYDFAPEEIDDNEQLPDDYASKSAAEKKFSNLDEAVVTMLPDYFYSSKEMDNKELSNDYTSEVEVINKNVFRAPGKELIDSKFTDDYSPEVVKVVSSKLTDDYSPEVVKVIGSKLNDDYTPEMVKESGTKHLKNKSIREVEEKFSVYSPEVKKVIKTKQKTEQLYLPNWKLLNTNDKDYEEVASQEPFTSKDKIKIKSDNKLIKIKSTDNKVSSDFQKLEKKKSKLEHKNKSQLVKSETQDADGYLISIKNPHSKPIIMSSGKLEYKKTEYTVKRDDDLKKENSNKIKPTMTPKNEYLTHKTHKIKIKDGVVTDTSKSTLGVHEKITSTHRSTPDLSEDESREKMEDNSRDLLIEKPFDSDESFEAFDLDEIPGSGDIVNNEDSRSGSLFSNGDLLRSLSTLNSNLWSLIFNPNAEFKKEKKCITRSNEPGFCMYVQQCDIPNVVTSLEQLLQDACVIDDIFIGICCPEFPVQTVKVHWEQMPTDTDKRTDDFTHKSDDCGIRSDTDLNARSWPWKAPLVSMSNGRIFCDGVLIRDNYVLTAAHCTRKIPKNQILVRLGQYDESSGEDYAVVEIKRHAQYNRRSMLNDIALLKLGRRIRHDEHTNIICIPDDDDDDDDNDDDDDHEDDHEDDHAGEKAILLGSRGSFNINSKKDERLKVMKNKECEQKLGMKVPSTMLCTEARNENERSCNTDSGAPLIIEDDNKYEVIGILSWNRNDCDQRFPSIFSRVSKYVRWIKKHTA